MQLKDYSVKDWLALKVQHSWPLTTRFLGRETGRRSALFTTHRKSWMNRMSFRISPSYKILTGLRKIGRYGVGFRSVFNVIAALLLFLIQESYLCV